MSSTFFTAVAQAVVGASQRISIDIEGLGQGRIKVLLSANLGPTPEQASEAEVKLRAALAKPLIVSGAPEEIEAALHARVQAHTVAINEGAAMLEQIRALGAVALAEVQKPQSGAAPVTEKAGEGESSPSVSNTAAPATPVAAYDDLAKSF